MKIKKLNESVLKEADKVEETELKDINPQTASTDEIAAGVQNAVEKTTEGEKAVSDAAANKVAQEIKKDAAEVNAGSAYFIPDESDYNLIEIESDLIPILNHCLDRARTYMRRKDKNGANLLIDGLPGSGKTAIVESWAKHRGLVLVAMNATDSKVDATVNGMPLRDITQKEANAIVYQYAMDKLGPLLDPKNEGKCVLFVDEYNRQRDQMLRRTFLSLFNEKRNADGKLDFSKTLLFSIVCINPAGKVYHDQGASELIQAEKTRFIKKPKKDSTPEEALRFFKGNLVNKLLDRGVVIPGTPVAKKRNMYGPRKDLTEQDMQDIIEELKVYDLGQYIVDNSNHPYIEFSFDSRDPNVQNDLHDLDRTELNQRELTDALYYAVGDKDEFLKGLEPNTVESFNFLDKDNEMLKEILDNYILDLDGLLKMAGITKDGKKADIENTEVEDTKQEPTEDDNKLFNQSADTKEAPSPSDVESQIKDAIKGW